MTATKRRGAPAPAATLGGGGGRTRVACYLRISTDEEHQPFSLGAQQTRLGAFVVSQPGWEQVIYEGAPFVKGSGRVFRPVRCAP